MLRLGRKTEFNLASATEHSQDDLNHELNNNQLSAFTKKFRMDREQR